MGSEENRSIYAFDNHYTTNDIRKLKILLPHLPNTDHRELAILIKLLELQFAIHAKDQAPSCQRHKSQDSSFQDELTPLLIELTPYCTEKECKEIDQIRSMLSTFSQMQELQSILAMMQDADSEGKNTNFDLSSIFENLSEIDADTLFQLLGKDNT